MKRSHFMDKYIYPYDPRLGVKNFIIKICLEDCWKISFQISPLIL